MAPNANKRKSDTPPPSTRPRRTNTPVEPTIVDDKDWTTGDFTLISSDNVRFRVDSMTLFVSSPVFREASELTSGDKVVHLTDPDFETAAVLRAFLNFVLKFRFPIVTIHKGKRFYPAPWLRFPSSVLKLGSFMNKYECHVDLLRLHYVLKTEHNANTNPGYSRDLFILSAMSKNVEGCAFAIRHSNATLVGDRNNANGSNSYTDTNPLIPTNMSRAIKDIVPENYLDALIKGWESSGLEHDREKWAAKFKLHLKP
ncbi:hypothetical protein Q8F55_002714 [Vanrija albida]|uniref:BTB domain-containing protein n=1 Tax=Vanrija albida TaxID=181172 RepID=A0ABR3QAR7_9TREE